MLAASLLPAAVFVGCGNASRSPSGQVVARVGGAVISRAEVEHWASAIELGNSVGTALGRKSGTPRERALEFLISSRWSIGEADAQGLSISKAAVQSGLRKRIETLPQGYAEFDEELVSTGQTIADVELEVESALAAARIRDAVAARVPAVTGAEMASYYAHHRQRFYLRARRLVDLVERIPGYAHAVSLGKQLGPGARFAKRAIRELVSRETPAEVASRPNGRIVHMIFAAVPGRVAGPAFFDSGWVLAVVRKMIPAEIQPLTAVRSDLSKTLAAERRKRVLKRFAAAYVRSWTARTSCSQGYVVRECSQYRGALAQRSH